MAIHTPSSTSNSLANSLSATPSAKGEASREANDDDFAALVAHFRRARGLSQGQLARAARLSRTYIYHLETGQRQAPSVRVARAISRALELHGADRARLARAYLRLTGKQMEDEAEGLDLLDQRELAAVLVRNSAFPAHSLDRFWHVSAWNRPAVELFEIDADALAAHSQNLLAVVFDPAYRTRFRPWEALARRLLAEFKYNTRSLTYLPEYRTLWRSLRQMPDFSRIADSSDPGASAVPSFVFQMRHSKLGPLMLRTTVTVFSGASDYSIVTYVPGDQQTLATFQANGWQMGERS
ncbi:MAG TPA: helix-turn-helix domain-containing protein [Ktedonobacterales bacterium]